LPNTTSIEPYLGLFSIVILHPDCLVGKIICTQDLPCLSILREGRFVPAHANKSPAAPDAARIFDATALTQDTLGHLQVGVIALSLELSTFNQCRYWWLLVNMEAILVALVEWVGRRTYSSEEITLTQTIFYILQLQKLYGPILIPAFMQPGSGAQGGDERLSRAPDGRGGAGPGRGSAGPGGSGAGPSRVAHWSDLKRNWWSEGSENTKKRRNHTGAGGVAEAGDLSRESGELPLHPSYSIRPTDVQDEPRPPPYGVHPDEWEVASSLSGLDDGTWGLGECGIGDCVELGDKSDLDDDNGFGELSLGCTLHVCVAHHWGLHKQNAILGAPAPLLRLLGTMMMIGSSGHRITCFGMFLIGEPLSFIEPVCISVYCMMY